MGQGGNWQQGYQLDAKSALTLCIGKTQMLNPDARLKAHTDLTQPAIMAAASWEFIIHVPWKFSAWGGWASVEPQVQT